MFCYIRNQSLRSVFGKKTRKNIEPIELQSQVEQLQHLGNLDNIFCNESKPNLKLIFDTNLSMMDKYEASLSQYCHNYSVKCLKCHKSFKISNSWMLEVDDEYCRSTNLSVILDNMTDACMSKHSDQKLIS